MTVKINKSVLASKPYKLSTQKAWLEKDKSKVLKLDWNESTIAPSPKVIEAFNKLIQSESINWYPNTNNSELVNLISDYCKVEEKNVQYFNGSDAVHEVIFKTFSSDKDVLTVIGPTYDHPRSVAECFGLSLDYFYLSKKFEFDIKRFKEHLLIKKPSLVYICSPNNPTGNTYSNLLVEDLLKEFPNILFIVDEAYKEFSNVTCEILPLRYDNIIVTRTFSKAFGLAAVRLGYCLSSEENINLMNKFRNPKSINLFAQVGGIASLKDINYTNNYVNEVNKAKSLFINEINSYLLDYIKPINGYGNFVLFENLSQKSSENIVSYFEENKIYIRNYGHIRNLENHLRITIGNLEQTKKAISYLKDFFI
tara:strand:+ start:997 stop:2094 length:1098 start_codon:yes stop_codon:yes gene_type:complete